MKTGLLLLAAGSLLLSSCKSGTDGSAPATPVPVAIVAPTLHKLYVLFEEKDAHSHDHTNEANNDTHQVAWTLRSDSGPALSEKIYANDLVEWHFTSKFFLYVAENQINWDKCFDGNNNPLPRTHCTSCPFNDTNHRAICATNIGPNDWVVRVVFPPYIAHRGQSIIYRLVSNFDCVPMSQGNKHGFAVPFDYYMVEATLVWDSAGLEHDHDK